MSDEKKPQETPKRDDTPKATPFTRASIKKEIEVKVYIPALYGDHHFDFPLRSKLSIDAENQRQDYMALAAVNQTSKYSEQCLDEIWDLLRAMPRGFDDLQDNGKGPGQSFREYIETAGDAKDGLMSIVEGASQLYWAKVLPREFRG